MCADAETHIPRTKDEESDEAANGRHIFQELQAPMPTIFLHEDAESHQVINCILGRLRHFLHLDSDDLSQGFQPNCITVWLLLLLRHVKHSHHSIFALLALRWTASSRRERAGSRAVASISLGCEKGFVQVFGGSFDGLEQELGDETTDLALRSLGGWINLRESAWRRNQELGVVMLTSRRPFL